MTLTTMSELAADHHDESQERLIREIESDFRDTGSLTRRDRMSPAVKAAMRAVPRHDFVEPSSRDLAYINRPLSIGLREPRSKGPVLRLRKGTIPSK